MNYEPVITCLILFGKNGSHRLVAPCKISLTSFQCQQVNNVSDKIIYANSPDLDQTAEAVWSVSTLFPIPLGILRSNYINTIYSKTSEILGHLQYIEYIQLSMNYEPVITCIILLGKNGSHRMVAPCKISLTSFQCQQVNFIVIHLRHTVKPNRKKRLIVSKSRGLVIKEEYLMMIFLKFFIRT